MPQQIRFARLLSSVSRSRRRLLAGLIAAVPVFQVTGCIPDVIGALNFQLQFLVNSVLIDAVNTIVRNILGL